MVYFLRNVKTGDTSILADNGHYSLGRSRLNTILLKNQHCSHEHAIIDIKDGYATISDKSSKRGTFVNKVQIHDEIKLQNKDVIQFGVKDCLLYSFIDPQFYVVLADNINTRIAVEEALKELRVPVLENYSQQCTHYVADKVNVEMLRETRILDAVIDQKPVVTPQFFIRMLENIHEAVELPNIYKYKPEIEESLKNKGLEYIIPRKKRSELFKDSICIFFDEALEKSMEHLIWRCGGGTLQHNNQATFAITLTEGFDFLEAIIVTQEPLVEPSLVITYFIDKLRQLDKTVQELTVIEIYIAVLQGQLGSSTEKNRNQNQRSGESEVSVIADDHESLPKTLPKRPTTTKMSSIERAVKKKYPKKNYTTLNRWIWQSKKKNTSENRKDLDTSLDIDSSENDDGNELPKNDKRKTKNTKPSGKFNISLDFSSTSDEEGSDRESQSHKNPNNEDGFVGINSDESEPDQRSTQTGLQKKTRPTKKGQHLKNKEIIVLDSSSEKIILETAEKPNSPQKNFKSFQKTTAQRSVNVVDKTSKSKGLSSELRHQLNPSTSETNSSAAKSSELNHNVPQKRKKECDTQKTTLSLEPKDQKTRLKVNPFARLKTSNTLKSKKSQKLPDVRRLNDMFPDVDIALM